MSAGPGVAPQSSRCAELVALVRAEPWMLEVLTAVERVGLPEAWVGGGVLRDLVWDGRAGGFDPARVADVDVAYFDAADWSSGRDAHADAALRLEAPHVPWQAKNQAAVHTWYRQRFGVGVAPLTSTLDGVATWPEPATAVAVRTVRGRIEVAAPCGLDDLLDGVWRRNPRRVSVAEHRRRLAAKRVEQRWPFVTVIRE